MGRVSFTTDNYYDAMKKLLPQGPAWELEDNTFFMKMLYLAALEFARLDADIFKMIDESDPQSASVTLLDWFHQWGIPEECRSEEDDLEVLITQLLIKIRTLGLTFQELVYLIGQSCGYSETKIDSKHVFTVASTVDDALYSEIWANWFYTINVEKVNSIPFKTTSRVSERLQKWGNELFECLVKHYTPAHTSTIFTYGK